MNPRCNFHILMGRPLLTRLTSALAIAVIAGTLLLVAVARAAAPRTLPAPARPAPPRVDLAGVPLSFEENTGQAHDSVRFLARGPGYALFLTPSEAVLAVAAPQARTAPARAPSARRTERPPVDVLRMALVGANPGPEVVGLELLPGRVNYFRGNDRARWRPDVRTYAKVRYRNVYTGIDVVYHGTQDAFEYDFGVAPGADPRAIALRFDQARRIELDGRGDLVLHLAHGAVRQPKPVVYQDIGGARRSVDGRYVVNGRRVGFEVAAYDGAHPLVIDPVLVYSTYVGGTDVTEGIAIAVDGSGNTYVAGTSIALDFPAPGAVQPGNGGSYDAVVMKLNATATALVYATYLGGTDDDSAFAIDVDGAGDAYVAGFTRSSDFPTASPLQPANAGGFADAFVTRLNASGSALVYSTYLGGADDDEAFALKVDALGTARVAGFTASSNFPTTAAALQPAHGGNYDGFLAHVSASGAALLQSTYLGGSDDDWVLGLAVDAAGALHLAGATGSTDFPITPGARQPSLGGSFDAFVVKLDAGATTRLYSTYHGGTDYDEAWAIAVDAAGNAHVTARHGRATSPP
ncbi:MAG TPA: SBBP repeat-containing protein [Candidatus Limnocylindria bacterium]|nr:SBBP repeat-containing protein [Candidatus Limnocylindria bacterium]